MCGRRLVAAALVLVFGSACAVGPNYVRPEVTPPEDYRGQVTPVEAASLADLPWWEVFEDEVLQGLVLEALKANYDLKIAVQRVAQAQAPVGAAQSPF